MTTLLNEYVRATETLPCPVCGKSDWCLIHQSGKKCLCQRVPSARRFKTAGWLHFRAAATVPAPNTTKKRYVSPGVIERYCEENRRAEDDDMLKKHADSLMLSVGALRGLRVTYDRYLAAIGFPMFNERGRVTGVRNRRRDGSKLSYKGGREGVFVSKDFQRDGLVLVSEGPTDAAALVYAGFQNVLGKPNCYGGDDIIVKIMAGHEASPVVIVADPDNPGVTGARELAQKLPNYCVIVAAETDIREFITSLPYPGEAVSAIIEAATGFGSGRMQKIGDTNVARRSSFFREIAKLQTGAPQ